MTGWTSLTKDEVLAQFNDSETTAYDTAKGDDKGLALLDIIAKVTDQILQAYAEGGRLVDTISGTIPNGEKNRAIAMVRWKYLLAIPTGKSLAENRETEATRAEEYFQKVAERKIKFSGVAVANPGRAIRTSSFDKLGCS